MHNRYKLFDVFGIESEYMIVSKNTLIIRPEAEFALSELNGGTLSDDVEKGKVSWSNELVSHLVEVKCNGPQESINEFDKEFHKAILECAEILSQKSMLLLPTAMHPWMNPDTETTLWPHGYKDVYNQYNKIFNCKGHGWSNLQSVHINLPFFDDKEFRLLHSAIRVLLPIIPFFSASSPFVEGRRGPLACNRMSYYESNQRRVPSIASAIIPEVVKSTADYNHLMENIYKEIAPLDREGILQHPWLNSRGVIPKFEFGALEIRVMDIQESPYMDFSLIHLFIALLKDLTTKECELLESVDGSLLRSIYDAAKTYDDFRIPLKYAALFGISDSLSASEFAIMLMEKYRNVIPKYYHLGLETIIKEGNLSKRLIKNSSGPHHGIYKRLADTLLANSIFHSED